MDTLYERCRVMYVHMQIGICRPLLSYGVAGTVGSKCGT